MPAKKDDSQMPLKWSNEYVALLDEPPLGHLQAIVLKTLLDLDDKAWGYRALEALMQKTGVFIDHSKVYATIRGLKELKCLIGPTMRKSPRGGPPLRIYTVSAEGREMLKKTMEHHQVVFEYLAR